MVTTRVAGRRGRWRARCSPNRSGSGALPTAGARALEGKPLEEALPEGEPVESAFKLALRQHGRDEPLAGARLREGIPVENTSESAWLGGCVSKAASRLLFLDDIEEVDVVYSISEKKFLNVVE